VRGLLKDSQGKRESCVEGIAWEAVRGRAENGVMQKSVHNRETCMASAARDMGGAKHHDKWQ
jgi:hypothetical protein